MTNAATYLALVLAGLAGSLHCLGMCGPILLGFSQIFESASQRSRLDFVWYHSGRIWTYGVLGVLAGWVGESTRQGAIVLGWQRPVSIALAVVVILAGLILLGLLPGLRLDGLANGCAVQRMKDWPWFGALLRQPGALPRLLLGAVMGVLPCGLVYAMLVVVAALPSPLHSGVGMVVFGLGTIPSLSLVLLGSRLAPPWLRAQGTRLVGAALLLTGAFMATRSLWVPPPS